MKITPARLLLSAGHLVLEATVVLGMLFAALVLAQSVGWAIGTTFAYVAATLVLLAVIAVASPWVLAGAARVQERFGRETYGLAVPEHPVRRGGSGEEFSVSASSLAQFADRRNWWGFANAVVAVLTGTAVLLLAMAIGIGVGYLVRAIAHPSNVVAVFTVPVDRGTVIGVAIGAIVVGLGLIVGILPLFAILTRAMLVPSKEAELREAARAERDRRRHAISAADIEQGRLERDLHDGVQPQLVSVAMTLALAKRKLATDASAAEELIDEAIRTTKLSIGDLRALVRGMRPAILSDRGLDAALSALVSSSAVPVRLVNEVTDRADVTTELVVYFAVAESVTNAMKHSGATNIDVRIWRSEHGLRADIRDNGHGGALLTPGGGLQGVRERVAAAGGSMVFSSPAGGPTEIEVMVPCAS